MTKYQKELFSMSKKWNPPYKCQYCQKILYNKDYLYKVHMYAQETKNDRILSFNCNDCRANFKYSVLQKATIEISFFITKDRTYESIINPLEPKFQVKYYDRNIDLYQFHEKILLNFPYIPNNWNPTTAPEKLKLYLTFS